MSLALVDLFWHFPSFRNSNDIILSDFPNLDSWGLFFLPSVLYQNYECSDSLFGRRRGCFSNEKNTLLQKTFFSQTGTEAVISYFLTSYRDELGNLSVIIMYISTLVKHSPSPFPQRGSEHLNNVCMDDLDYTLDFWKTMHSFPPEFLFCVTQQIQYFEISYKMCMRWYDFIWHAFGCK